MCYNIIDASKLLPYAGKLGKDTSFFVRNKTTPPDINDHKETSISLMKTGKAFLEGPGVILTSFGVPHGAFGKCSNGFRRDTTMRLYFYKRIFRRCAVSRVCNPGYLENER
jgi:hypothetical protein